MKIRAIAAISAIVIACAGSWVEVSPMAAHADAAEPVQFDVASGALSISQTPTAGTTLVQNTAVQLPQTVVTDGRNNAGRTGAWTVTITASNLVHTAGADSATIGADQITMDEISGAVAAGGTITDEPAVVGTGALVSITGDGIDSTYTYTPTAQLASQTKPFSGAYVGTITQTVA
ncbi:MAG: hypothetical protein JWM12_1096 [Ilumatobacteraceae bacterium]|nr:hypothetical protein [Ilumatobacteraceae bacterium]